MSELQAFIESGIIEMYVLGSTTAEESAKVEAMAKMYEEVRTEIEETSLAFEQYAMAHAIEPSPVVGAMIMASIGYMERLKNGEQPSFPPLLNENSKIEDYSEWLNREDMQPDPKSDIYISIIGYTPEVTTAIVWLKYGAPPEIHTEELEKFMIVEGTCEITIGSEVHVLQPGDTLTMPLHVSHHVTVTSDCICKIILQRAAA